jgi:hypothetical protein
MYVCGFLGASSPNTIWNYVKNNKKFEKSENIKKNKDIKNLKFKWRPPCCDQHNLSTKVHDGDYNIKLPMRDLWSSQWWGFRLKPLGMVRCVVGWVFPDVTKVLMPSSSGQSNFWNMQIQRFVCFFEFAMHIKRKTRTENILLRN